MWPRVRKWASVPRMRSGLSGLIAAAVALLLSSSALAAATPKSHSSFFYVEVGTFSITLDIKSSKKILAGPAYSLTAQYPTSAVLVVCPQAVANGPFTELHLGFPGAALKLVKGRYAFTRSYTEKNGKLAVVGTSATKSEPSASIKVTGTVMSSKLITGTVSVNAPGCSLKSSKYKAKLFRAIPV
jgi:hypothetical protein